MDASRHDIEVLEHKEDTAKVVAEVLGHAAALEIAFIVMDLAARLRVTNIDP